MPFSLVTINVTRRDRSCDEYKEYPDKPEYGDGTIEKWPGCTRAVDNYFAGRPEEIQYYKPTKKFFVVKAPTA